VHPGRARARRSPRTDPVIDDWDGLVGLARTIDHDHDHGYGYEIPRFDPELEYLIAAARVGRYLPAVKDPVLLDKLATIFEDALRDRIIWKGCEATALPHGGGGDRRRDDGADAPGRSAGRGVEAPRMAPGLLLGSAAMVLSLLGILAGLAAAGIGAWASLRSRHRVESRLELVDVTVHPHAQSESGAMIDIKVRNVGGQPAVLKRIVLSIEDAVMYEHYTPPAAADVRSDAGAPLLASFVYQVELPGPYEAKGRCLMHEISQVVSAGDADRFLISLGPSRELGWWGEKHTALYRLRLTLIHDHRDSQVTSLPLAISLCRPPEVPLAAVVRSGLRRFIHDVTQLRTLIDDRRNQSGLPPMDWADPSPPRLGDVHLEDIVPREEFWYPELAVRTKLDSLTAHLKHLVALLGPASVRPAGLDLVLRDATVTLRELPAIRRELNAL
jgi:hypothetical protein